MPLTYPAFPPPLPYRSVLSLATFTPKPCRTCMNEARNNTNLRDANLVEEGPDDADQVPQAEVAVSDHPLHLRRRIQGVSARLLLCVRSRGVLDDRSGLILAIRGPPTSAVLYWRTDQATKEQTAWRKLQ